jgi:dihydroxy-acid dehydratase
MPNQKLRSAEWFARSDEMGLLHRAVLGTVGYDMDRIIGRPIIGICNPVSDFNRCEIGFHELVPAIKRGVIEAGGIPLEFPTMALGADLLKPADMLYRNLVSMDIEESIRGYPIDGVVLLCNCDKTTPAQLMAAASADIPAIQFSAGARAAGFFRGEPISSGADLWRYWDEYRAGQIDQAEWRQFEACLACSSGACNEMGTTSTMTSLSEALGMMPAGSSSIPANDSRRLTVAGAVGRRIVEMVHEDLRPSAVLTQQAFENAIRVCAAIGGSTNAVIHLTAIAGRRGLRLPLTLFDELFKSTPLLANLKPSGQYLMAHFHLAGGLPALLKQLETLLHLDCLTVSGQTLGQTLLTAQSYDSNVIRPLDNPLDHGGALVALRGNLVPAGAILKVSAATPALLDHTGPALVFEGYAEMLARIEAADLDVTPDSVLVMRNAGPCGVPGMPEWGQIPIPTKLLRQGVRDMVRISDARMSGTSYGTVVLHAAPEAAVGGPLAVVQNGDRIRLNVAERRLDLLLSEQELQTRLARWTPPPRRHLRGYPRMYIEHVLQADEGCDFDFLRPESEEALRFVPPQVGRS